MSHITADRPNSTHSTALPGPPRNVFEFRSWSTSLWALVLLTAVIAAQAFVADYLDRTARPPEERSWLFRCAWLDARAAVTGLVAMFGLAITRDHVALGFRPFLSYSNISPKREDTLPKFSVVLRNDGTGPAVISQVKYELRSQNDDLEFILEHEKAVNRIELVCGLKEGVDYQLPRFSRGATIGKDKERTAMEVNNDAIDRLLKLRDFDIKVQYRGMLGDLYEKTVHCLPRSDYRRPRRVEPQVERARESAET